MYCNVCIEEWVQCRALGIEREELDTWLGGVSVLGTRNIGPKSRHRPAPVRFVACLLVSVTVLPQPTTTLGTYPCRSRNTTMVTHQPGVVHCIPPITCSRPEVTPSSPVPVLSGKELLGTQWHQSWSEIGLCSSLGPSTLAKWPDSHESARYDVFSTSPL